MKQLILLIFLLHLVPLKGQNRKDSVKQQNNAKKQENISLDPRKFVKIYDKRENEENARLISEYPLNQYISYIDPQSTLLIDFDIDKLSEDDEFFGCLSLMAKINDKEIEIDGYTKIGEKEKIIGLSDAFSSHDFAASLVGMISRSEEYKEMAGQIQETIDSNKVYSNRSLKMDKQFRYANDEDIMDTRTENTIIDYMKSLQSKKTTYNRQTLINKWMQENPDDYFSNTFNIINSLPVNMDNKSAIQSLNALVIKSQKKRSDIDSTENSIESKKAYLYKQLFFKETIEQVEKNNLSIFKAYVKYFIKTNPYALNALSLSLNRDPVFIYDIISGLQENISRYENLSPRLEKLNQWITDDNVKLKQFKDSAEFYSKTLMQNIRRFDRLFDKLSTTGNDYILDNFRKVREEHYKRNEQDYRKEMDYFYSMKKKCEKYMNFSTGERYYYSGKKRDTLNACYEFYHNFGDTLKKKQSMLKNGMYSDRKFIDTLIHLISQTIAKNAFSQLNTGSLDLEKISVKEGDKLEISVLWYTSREVMKTDGTVDTLKKVTVLPMTKVHIKNINWKVNVVESFFLINRVNPDLNDGNISPSRFKGAPGGSLLVSFGSDKRRYISYKKISDDNPSRLIPDKKRRVIRSLKALEPSFGLNVSYLDFDTRKDFEVGTGLVLGLFRNSVLFKCGYNLNVQNHPFYYGVGFSFGQVYQNIKTGFKFQQ